MTRHTWLEHAHEWVVTVDHKRLGIMYVVSGLVFFVIAGLEASLMRLQLAWPGLHIVPPETFNRLFTMHGTTHGVPGRASRSSSASATIWCRS